MFLKRQDALQRKASEARTPTHLTCVRLVYGPATLHGPEYARDHTMLQKTNICKAMFHSRTKALLGLRLSPIFPTHQALRTFATTRSLRQKPSRFPPDRDLEAQLADLQKHLDEHKKLLAATAADRRTQKRLQAELDFLQTFAMLRTYAQELTSAPSSSSSTSSPAGTTDEDSVKRNEELFWQLRMLWRTNVDSTYHTLMAPSGEVPVSVRVKRVVGFVIISVATGLTYPLSWIIRALP